MKLAGVTLDTGALIALDHPSKALRMQGLLLAVRRRNGSVCIAAGAIAQAWRSPRQVRLARLMKAPDVEIAVLNLNASRTIGEICAATGHADVVDVHVALCARERVHVVVTSDPNDILRIDPTLPTILI